MGFPGTTAHFQWPDPASPTGSSQDITIKEILEKYSDDPDLLKHILIAKTEEDKRRSARDLLHIEQARIQHRNADYDQWHRAPQVLPSLQQQALARLSEPYHAQQSPHSAHPLCPPRTNRPTMQYTMPARQTSIASPSADLRHQRNSDISHDKVMEALKAKIQRGNSIHSANSSTAHGAAPRGTKRAKLTTIVAPVSSSSPSSKAGDALEPSPRSARPTLPSIDTSIGRLQSSLSPENRSSPAEEDSTIDSASPTDKVIHRRNRRARSLSPIPSSHDRVLATAVTES